eukprot:759928-Hanusia_phi.AAC.11
MTCKRQDKTSNVHFTGGQDFDSLSTRTLLRMACVAETEEIPGQDIGDQSIADIRLQQSLTVFAVQLLMAAINTTHVSPRLIDVVVVRIRQVQEAEERERGELAFLARVKPDVLCVQTVKEYLKQLPEIVRVAIKLSIRSKVKEKEISSSNSESIKNLSFVRNLNVSLNQSFVDFYSGVKKRVQEQFSTQPRGGTPRPISRDESDLSSLGINVKSESAISEPSDLIKSEELLQASMSRRDADLAFSSMGVSVQSAPGMKSRQRKEFPAEFFANEQGEQVASNEFQPKSREVDIESLAVTETWDDTESSKDYANRYYSHVSGLDLKQIELAQSDGVMNYTGNETLHQFFVRTIQRNGLKIGVLNGNRLDNIVSFYSHKQKIYLLYRDRQMNFIEYFKFFNLDTSIDQIRNLYFLQTRKSLYNEFGGEIFVSEFFQKYISKSHAKGLSDSAFSFSSVIAPYSLIDSSDGEILDDEPFGIKPQVKQLNVDKQVHRDVFTAMQSDRNRWNDSMIDNLLMVKPDSDENYDNASLLQLSNTEQQQNYSSIRSLLRANREAVNASQVNVSGEIEGHSDAAPPDPANFVTDEEMSEDSNATISRLELNEISGTDAMKRSYLALSKVKPLSREFYESIYGAENLIFRSSAEAETISFQSRSEKWISESLPEQGKASRKEMKSINAESQSLEKKRAKKRTVLGKLDTLCVGCQFYEGIRHINGSATVLKFQREPENKYDKNAIRLELISPTNISLGYLMKSVASWVAPLMDSNVLKFDFRLKNKTFSSSPQQTNATSSLPVQVKLKGYPGEELTKRRNRKLAHELIPKEGIPIYTGSDLEYHTLKELPRLLCERSSLTVKLDNGTKKLIDARCNNGSLNSKYQNNGMHECPPHVHDDKIDISSAPTISKVFHSRCQRNLAACLLIPHTEERLA